MIGGDEVHDAMEIPYYLLLDTKKSLGFPRFILQSTLHHHFSSSPLQSPGSKGGRQGFLQCRDEDKLHLVTDFTSDIMLHVFAVSRGENNLGDPGPVCTKYLP